MKKFEHLTVVVDKNQLSGDQLKEYGELGYELVSVVHTLFENGHTFGVGGSWKDDRFTYYFKREKVD